jgi:hypothetical protein
MTPGQPFHYDVWFSYESEDVFWGQSELPDPIWSSEDYDLTYTIHDKNKRQLNLTIPLDDDYYQRMYQDNSTLFLHY